jgi:hypothetical protein
MSANDNGILDQEAVARPIEQTKVVIIDDAFDPVSSGAISDEIRREFLDEIERNEELADELHQSRFTFEDPSDFSDDFFSALISADPTLPALSATFTRYYERLKREREEVVSLADMLEADRTLAVHRLGAADVDGGRAKDFRDAAFVFLDYYLGPPGYDAVRRAQIAAMDLRPGPAEAEADGPLIVLMSSRPEAESRRTEFRETAKVLGAAFFFYPKHQLDDAWKVRVTIENLRFAVPHARKIAEFVSALNREAQAALEVLLQKVHELEIADYSYLQTMRLAADGHPFGDYVTWLLGAQFSHELFELRLRDPKAVLNRLHISDRLVSYRPPSSAVEEFYMSAVLERGLGPLAAHPRQKPDAENADIPMLLMGDIFHCNMDALMVATADCDMAMAPDRTRVPDRKQSIVLIPGKLVSVTENAPSEESTARTEIYAANGKTYAINWELDKWFSKPFEQVWNWLTTEGYDLLESRVRLRPLFALSIQQKMHAYAARVGLPKEPPLFRSVESKLFWNDTVRATLVHTFEPGEINLVRVKHEQAQEQNDKKDKGTKCWMDLSVVAKLREELGRGLEQWNQQIAELKPGAQQKRLVKRAEAATAALADHARWTAVACTPVGLVPDESILLTVVRDVPNKKQPPGTGGLVLYIPRDDA